MKDLTAMAEKFLEDVHLQVGIRVTDAIPRDVAIQAIIQGYRQGWADCYDRMVSSVSGAELRDLRP